MTGTFAILDEFYEPNYKSTGLLGIELKVHFPAINWSLMRDPFHPPYASADIRFLDAIHEYIGIHDEWMASERRERILKGKRSTKTWSGDRTRSKRWRAGCKSEKPKYNWNKRKRTNFC